MKVWVIAEILDEEIVGIGPVFSTRERAKTYIEQVGKAYDPAKSAETALIFFEKEVVDVI